MFSSEITSNFFGEGVWIFCFFKLMKVVLVMKKRGYTAFEHLPKWMLLSVFLIHAAHAATCDFAPVKKEIDVITNVNTSSGQEYRKRVQEGWDSVKVLNDMTSADMRASIDVCRFDVAEYLTKLGFAPAH